MRDRPRPAPARPVPAAAKLLLRRSFCPGFQAPVRKGVKKSPSRVHPHLFFEGAVILVPSMGFGSISFSVVPISYGMFRHLLHCSGKGRILDRRLHRITLLIRPFRLVVEGETDEIVQTLVGGPGGAMLPWALFLCKPPTT